MADSLVNMSSQFGGLPMDQLIGGPLKAACTAQTLLAKASSDFIKDVGLDDAGGGNMNARTVDFSFNKPVQAADGTTKLEKVDLQVPLLAIINTPALSVKEAEVRFTLSTTLGSFPAMSPFTALWPTTARTAARATTAPSTT